MKHLKDLNSFNSKRLSVEKVLDYSSDKFLFYIKRNKEYFFKNITQ